ncbi:MAG: hypothetical protein M5U19_21810 [Microthrixaceae bacterium]|nr:hypothetical protein [Microthrixaceae bacterium]
MAMVEAVEHATGGGVDPDTAACTTLIEDLTAAGSPPELAKLIEPIDDEVLRSTLGAVRSAAAAIVGSCSQVDDTAPKSSSPGTDADPVVQGTESAALFHQRVAQLEEEG